MGAVIWPSVVLYLEEIVNIMRSYSMEVKYQVLSCTLCYRMKSRIAGPLYFSTKLKSPLLQSSVELDSVFDSSLVNNSNTHTHHFICFPEQTAFNKF